ncbi:MAG: HIT family protein [Lentisphaerae bacterium]|nr:HIT family protein [Lentisphaerota bacterium]
MSNCIFCKIIAGEIPSMKLYEDELVYAFLDIAPINFGHVLVIPKEHHESASTIPEATAGRMMKIGTRLGIALKRALDYDAYNLHLADGKAAGQVVMHAHLHVVPRGVDDDFRWNWRQKQYADGQAADLAEKVMNKFKVSEQE